MAFTVRFCPAVLVMYIWKSAGGDRDIAVQTAGRRWACTGWSRRESIKPTSLQVPAQVDAGGPLQVGFVAARLLDQRVQHGLRDSFPDLGLDPRAPAGSSPRRSRSGHDPGW